MEPEQTITSHTEIKQSHNVSVDSYINDEITICLTKSLATYVLKLLLENIKSITKLHTHSI